MYYLSRAIAEVCIQLEGLQYVQLPAGLPQEYAQDIVRAANTRLQTSPPLAILVGDLDDLDGDALLPRVSRRNVIKYRRGNRLAVVAGSSVDLASFDGSYRSVVGPGFPMQATESVTINTLAPFIVKDLTQRLDIAVDDVVSTRCGEELALAMQVLASSYELATDTTRVWNGLWFEHVERGLIALSDAIRDMHAESGSEPFGATFEKYVWPAMGLPQPAPQKDWRPSRAPREFMDALNEYWGDTPSVELSLAQLRQAIPDHEWSKLSWSDLEQARIERESLLGALQDVVSGPFGIRCWADMDRERFESPLASSEALAIRDADSGHSLAVEGDGSPALVRAEEAGGMYTSTPFTVAIPTSGRLGRDALQDIRVKTSSSAVSFEPTTRRAEDGTALITGCLRGRAKSSTKPVQLRLSLALAPASTAAGVVAARAEATILILLSSVGALAWPLRPKSLGKVVYAGPQSRDEDLEGGDFSNDLTSNAAHLVVVWGSGPSSSSSTLRPLAATEFESARIAEGADFEMEVDGTSVLLRGASGAAGYVTPLTAAVMKGSLDESPLPDSVGASVRGLMERHLSGTNGYRLLDVLGHVVVSSDQTTTETTFDAHPEAGVAGIPGFISTWVSETGLSVPADVVRSTEAEELREAARAILESVEDVDAEQWPSRTSWMHLAGSAVLDRYLRAYAALVERCRPIGPMARFWSCFPFSVSVWDGRRCVAVLLSPLHPVRLAWLASAEATFMEAETAHRLAGTVEGWQFPCIGPAPTPNGRMLAIPSDAGHEQVFAAWSMMVPASSDQNDQLSSPSRALGKPAPGTSPSGLTASAAEAALRDFLRANPHIPSLTIDLAASRDTARLEEVDRAVIATIHAWSKASNRWGVRVLDSTHRTGDIPRSELTTLMGSATGGCTLTWSRYAPRRGDASHRSNIRLLQDSGAEVRTLPAQNPTTQVAGPLPLRRFSVGDRIEGGEAFRGANLSPTGWPAFDSAVGAVENTPSAAEIGVRLAQSYLIDRSADWTVSGEAFLSPAAVSALVSAPAAPGGASGERVLWEWRPPFLQGRHGGTLDRRPYVTVARVSTALRNNLSRKLRDITSWEGDRLDQTASDVLMRLGTHGLGLSSLLTRGGTHESGALGFYLTYELLALGRDAASQDIVLPIDACDTFLTALGGNELRDRTKRADLLLMRFQGDEVVLVPVEIKFYGSEMASGHRLPIPGPAFNEALGQLAETYRSLEKVIETAEASRGADRALWFSAFTTLVESGLHLGGGRPDQQAHGELLSALVRGRTRIRLGRPLVTYFAHEPDSNDEYLAYKDQVHGQRVYGAFVGRPRTVFKSLSPEGSITSVAECARDLVKWATASDEASSNRESSRDERRGSAIDETPQTHTESLDDTLPTDEPAKRPSTPDSPSEAVPSRLPVDGPTVGSRPTDLMGDGIRFSVGRYVGSVGQANPEFWPSNTQLNQLNVGVVGDLGTGKTQLLQGLILNLRRHAERTQPNPLSFLIFDYKRDFQKQEFLEAVGGVVVRPHNIPFNPFQLKEQYSNLLAYERAKDFCDVLERIYSGVGPVQRQRLTNALLDSYAAHPDVAPTMSEVLSRYQEEVTADSVTSILRDFVMREVFMEGDGPTSTFEDLLHDKVVVLALNELGNDQDGKNALVALFLNEYYAYMQSRTKWPFEGQDPALRRLNSYLLVDEAVNILRYDFEVLENVLLQGREFGVGVMLSSQFLSHFKTARKNWAEPLLTWFIHKVPHVTPKDLERIGFDASPALADQIGTLPIHEAIYKSLGVPGRRVRGNPFFELVQREGGE